jgi:hypothetical protein
MRIANNLANIERYYRRLADADGRWLAYRGPKGREYFELEPAGEPGRWNTLRALRVLKWWEGEG